MPTRLPRARDLGFPFSGNPGPLNAITDVPGVAVGYETLWAGEGRLERGHGPIRTGVTAILPRGRGKAAPCFAASFALNAAGEMTGVTWLEERGLYEGPILITNTHSVGVVRDAAIQWMRDRQQDFTWAIPIVGETFDGLLNDIDGEHVRKEHVYAALDHAVSAAAIAEGNVGGGAGMITYEFKGGTGTSSRKVVTDGGEYTVGVLVQSNYGERRHLRIGGIKVGEQLDTELPTYQDPSILPEDLRRRYPRYMQKGVAGSTGKAGDGSIIVIVATDAPVLPHQLKRIAKRPSLAIGRLGGIGAAWSGDIFLAFSTAHSSLSETRLGSGRDVVEMVPNLELSPFFEATIDATEEAIINALVAADAVEGANRLRVPRLPHNAVMDLLSRYGVLQPVDGSRSAG